MMLLNFYSELLSHIQNKFFDFTFYMDQDIFAFAREARESRIQQAAIEIQSSSDEENVEIVKILTYSRVLEEKGEEGVKDLTNFNVEQFHFLWEIVKTGFPTRRGKKPMLSYKDRFFILLTYMNIYGKYKEMSTLMGMSPTMLYNVISDTLQ